MASLNKINIYISIDMHQKIMHDCEFFHIEKNKKGEPIKNKFITRLILATNQSFIDQYEQRSNIMKQALEATLKDKEIDEDTVQKIAKKYTEQSLKIEEKKRKGMKGQSQPLSYKPVDETERFLNSDFLKNTGLSRGSYLKNMLMDYFSEPMAVRETILYKDIYDQLNNFCHKQTPITIYTKNDKPHKIIPYKMVQGHNGMYTYLLCGEIANTLLSHKQNVHKVMEARCYHLFLIDQVDKDHKRRNEKLNEQVIEQLKTMIKKGPEHAINSSNSAKIRMTKVGKSLFTKIYNDRPIPDKQPVKEGKHYIYTFTDCSSDQLFFYFRRFGPEAEVLEPESLRNRLIEFHKKCLDVYK